MNDEILKRMITQPGKGYGIYNIRERIELYYGQDCGVFSSISEGFTVFTVKILREMKSPF